MPSMHVSVFISPKDRVEASAMAISEARSYCVSVRLHSGGGESPDEVSLYADSLEQLAAFGRAIVEQCEMLAAGPATEPESAPDPFLPSAQEDAVVDGEIRMANAPTLESNEQFFKKAIRFFDTPPEDINELVSKEPF